MTGKVLTFYLGGLLFGLDIVAVKEIQRNIEYTPVPDSPAHIVGLFNMRGQVVTLLDLAYLLNNEKEPEKGRTVCIVLKPKADAPDHIGFLIERTGSVVDIHDDISEGPPANMSGELTRFVKEVVKLNEELLMVIDSEVIFEQ
ncbi:chemotaxis protein CheW [Heliobacillus mobilis]|uniref:Chemotaxis protein CheW n=1 Tax=Heliobacterium mobile TaxID=28064 RepID=A0A6I3SJ99_HELMO|nr:chemotaxis protein CheW [Heliobacterium mobile]MTV48886.1 chemotaxis protein CheW [Heliobacterium mobile]